MKKTIVVKSLLDKFSTYCNMVDSIKKITGYKQV